MGKSLKNSIVTALLISILAACDNTPNTGLVTQPTVSPSGRAINEKGSVKPVSDTSVADDAEETPATADLDEASIYEAIRNNPQYFPTDLNNDSDSMQATVPNNGGVIFATVPNNGGVIFATPESGFEAQSFATKSLVSDLIENNDNSPLKEKVENIKERLNRLKASLPDKWGRKLLEKPKRKINIDFNEGRTQANVTVTTTYRKRLIINRVDGDFNRENIQETTINKVLFLKENNKWEITGVSPIETTSGDNSGLNIEAINVFIPSESNAKSNKKVDIRTSGISNKNNLANINEGEILTLNVKATSLDESFDPPVHVYARLNKVGFRLPLYDDGSADDIYPDVKGRQVSGDKTGNDDIYSANIKLKGVKAGLYHLTIDVIAAGTFNKDSEGYKAISKSVPLIIK